MILVPEKTLHFPEYDFSTKRIQQQVKPNCTHMNSHMTKTYVGYFIHRTIENCFWFNPIFIFLQKPYNSTDFLPEKVVNAITMFRLSILLLKRQTRTNFYLASNLNYLITKTITMMTKTHQIQNQSQKNYSDSALTGLINLMCIQTIAQTSTKQQLSAQ
jgi:hypothetical protein